MNDYTSAVANRLPKQRNLTWRYDEWLTGTKIDISQKQKDSEMKEARKSRMSEKLEAKTADNAHNQKELDATVPADVFLVATPSCLFSRAFSRFLISISQRCQWISGRVHQNRSKRTHLNFRVCDVRAGAGRCSTRRTSSTPASTATPRPLGAAPEGF